MGVTQRGRVDIAKAAENLYRDQQLSVRFAGPKVRRLIDEHIESQGIDPRVPPISKMRQFVGKKRFWIYTKLAEKEMG